MSTERSGDHSQTDFGDAYLAASALVDAMFPEMAQGEEGPSDESYFAVRNALNDLLRPEVSTEQFLEARESYAAQLARVCGLMPEGQDG